MLRKIRDIKPPCISHEHNPPMHIVLPPGEYEWTCPACGQKIRFIVSGPPMCGSSPYICNDGYSCETPNITWSV